jgi:protein gp37
MATKIEWVQNPDGTPGETLNPMGWGCYGPGGTKANPKRCSYCYAWRISKSRKTNCEYCRKFEVHQHPDRVYRPLRWKKPRAIFWQDMGDLFHPAVPDRNIENVWAIVQETPRHRHIFLTKNGSRLEWFNPWPKGACVGVTATNQVEFDLACEQLAAVEAEVRFVSCEPMLGPIFSSVPPKSIDWIIAGGETVNGRPTGRSLKSWVLDLCTVAGTFGIPIFVKDNVPMIGGEKLRQWPAAWRAGGKGNRE